MCIGNLFTNLSGSLLIRDLWDSDGRKNHLWVTYSGDVPRCSGSKKRTQRFSFVLVKTESETMRVVGAPCFSKTSCTAWNDGTSSFEHQWWKYMWNCAVNELDVPSYVEMNGWEIFPKGSGKNVLVLHAVVLESKPNKLKEEFLFCNIYP